MENVANLSVKERIELAKKGFHLNLLVQDKNKDVRIEVAKQGY